MIAICQVPSCLLSTAGDLEKIPYVLTVSKVKKETPSESALAEEGRESQGADAETDLINAMSKWPAPARTAPEVGIPPRSLLGVSGECRNMC